MFVERARLQGFASLVAPKHEHVTMKGESVPSKQLPPSNSSPSHDVELIVPLGAIATTPLPLVPRSTYFGSMHFSTSLLPGSPFSAPKVQVALTLHRKPSGAELHDLAQEDSGHPRELKSFARLGPASALMLVPQAHA